MLNLMSCRHETTRVICRRDWRATGRKAALAQLLAKSTFGQCSEHIKPHRPSVLANTGRMRSLYLQKSTETSNSYNFGGLGTCFEIGFEIRFENCFKGRIKGYTEKNKGCTWHN